MEITPSPYHTNYSPRFQWLPDMQDEDEVIIVSAAFDIHADNQEEFDLKRVAGTMSLTAGSIFYLYSFIRCVMNIFLKTSLAMLNFFSSKRINRIRKNSTISSLVCNSNQKIESRKHCFWATGWWIKNVSSSQRWRHHRRWHLILLQEQRFLNTSSIKPNSCFPLWSCW